jgi:hypothetical protein
MVEGRLVEGGLGGLQSGGVLGGTVILCGPPKALGLSVDLFSGLLREIY